MKQQIVPGALSSGLEQSGKGPLRGAGQCQIWLPKPWQAVVCVEEGDGLVIVQQGSGTLAFEQQGDDASMGITLLFKAMMPMLAGPLPHPWPRPFEAMPTAVGVGCPKTEHRACTASRVSLTSWLWLTA